MPATPIYPVLWNGADSEHPALLTVDGTSYRGAYAQIADVKLYFVNADIAAKVITNNTLLATLLADAAEDIDRVLETMYLTPIQPNTPTYATATNALQMLNFICKHLACAKVHEIISGADGYTEAHAAQAVTHHEHGSQRLDDIARGVTQLFDAAVQPGGEKPAWPAGIAAQYNPDYVFPAYPTDPEATAPLFGVRDDPPYADQSWVP